MVDQDQHFYNDKDPYDKEPDTGTRGFLRKSEHKLSPSGSEGSNEAKPLGTHGLYRSEKNATDSRAGLFNQRSKTSGSKGFKSLVWGSRKRKLITSGTGVTGSIVSLLMAILFTAAGPAQLIQLSHVLQNDFKGTNNSMSKRFNSMFTNSGPNEDLGQTRLGLLAGRFLNPIKAQLDAAGIKLVSNKYGLLSRVEIDVAKLRASDPNLSGYDTEQMRQYVAETVKIMDPALVKGTTTFIIDPADSLGNPAQFSIIQTRLLTSGSLDLLNNGKIQTAISARVLNKDFAADLFNPIPRVTALLNQKFATTIESSQQETADVNSTAIAGIEPDIVSATQALKGILGGKVGEVLGTGLLGTAVLCAVYNGAKTVEKYDHTAIVLPAALEAVRLIAVGDQVESGQHVSASQIGGAVNSLVDSKGQSVWAAKSLQVTEQVPSPTGPDLPTQYASAFDSKTTADGIQNDLNSYSHGLAGKICSTAGEIVATVAGLLLLISNLPDGESGTATFGYLAEQVGKGVVFGGAVYMAQKLYEQIIKDNAVVPALLSGPLGGNLLAYGARASANIIAIGDGGVALSNTDSTQISQQVAQENKDQFQSQSFFARLFNIDERSSLLGRLADYIRPSLAGMANVFRGMFNIGHLFSNLISAILPKASAVGQPYDWGFPVYGIPSNLIDSTDPSMQNPYQNGQILANILDAYDNPKSPNYSLALQLIHKASVCFGVNVVDSSGLWDVVVANAVDTNFGSYVAADCNNESALPYWNRMILFVFDTRTMQAYACYAGDATSCSETGY